jgi:outer membrane protein assembly factor BamB
MRFGGLALAICLAAGLAAAQSTTPATADWRQWRGPSRDGILTALPNEWPAELKKRWEVPVGTGHASPVIAGTRVVAIAREGDREVVRAIDLASGKILWKADYPAPYTVNPAAASHGPGPKSTPAIAGNRVFTFGISGVLSAFDLSSGKLLWQTKPPPVLPTYGTGMSPLVDRDAVIAHVGGHDKGALTAFDAASGKERWRWNGDGPGYGSPVIATIGGVRQLITITQKFLVGLNAADGTLLWQRPFTTAYDQNSVTPLITGDVVVYSGLAQPVVAARIRQQGSTWTADNVWSNADVPMFMSSPVRIGGTLFGHTHRGRGQLFALDMKTGKLLWRTEGREGENASLMGTPSWLLVSTTNGELLVGKPDAAAFKPARRYKIAESPVWAHPAISGRSFVIKDANKIVCWAF